MELYGKLVGCFFLCLAIASTSADPSVCYYCTTDADGTVCDEPADTGAIRFQHCGNLTVTDSSGISRDVSDESRAANGTYVCTTITYTSSLNTFVTMRECQSRQIEGVDICTYLTESTITSSYTRSFTCEACSSDLCNSANVHFSSFAFVAIILMKLIV